MGKAKRVRKEKMLRKRCKQLHQMLVVAGDIAGHYLSEWAELKAKTELQIPGSMDACVGCELPRELSQLKTHLRESTLLLNKIGKVTTIARHEKAVDMVYLEVSRYELRHAKDKAKFLRMVFDRLEYLFIKEQLKTKD